MFLKRHNKYFPFWLINLFTNRSIYHQVLNSLILNAPYTSPFIGRVLKNTIIRFISIFSLLISFSTLLSFVNLFCPT